METWCLVGVVISIGAVQKGCREDDENLSGKTFPVPSARCLATPTPTPTASAQPPPAARARVAFYYPFSQLLNVVGQNSTI
jgi:hypothetical protein